MTLRPASSSSSSFLFFAASASLRTACSSVANTADLWIQDDTRKEQNELLRNATSPLFALLLFALLLFAQPLCFFRMQHFIPLDLMEACRTMTSGYMNSLEAQTWAQTAPLVWLRKGLGEPNLISDTAKLPPQRPVCFATATEGPARSSQPS